MMEVHVLLSHFSKLQRIRFRRFSVKTGTTVNKTKSRNHNLQHCALFCFFYFILFYFIFSHLLYGIEVYGNTTSNHLSKLIILNNKLLRILQNKSIKHIIVNCMKNTVLSLCICYTNIKFWYLCISMYIVEINYQLFSLHILMKTKQYMIMILDRDKTFIPTPYILSLEKELLNIKGVNYGMIYQMISKI